MHAWKKALGWGMAFLIFFSVSLKDRTYAEVFYKLEEALKLVLPQAKTIKEEVKILTDDQKQAIEKEAGIEFYKEFDQEFPFYLGLSDKGAVIAYVCRLTVPGKWGPIESVIGISPSGEVTDIVVLSLAERRGRPVKERKFLGQFFGKKAADSLKLKKNIRAISGATISSRGMTEGVKKALLVFEEVYRSK